MRKMSITEALVELKTLDSRIEKATNKAWCAVVPSKDVDVPEVKEACRMIRANYDSVTDLISERAKIKAAIVKSNAVTTVNVGGELMSVAEAIEKKSSIVYHKNLKRTMEKQFEEHNREVKAENMKVQIRCDNILEKLVGSDRAKVSEEHQAVVDTFMANNKVELMDPINIQSKIEDFDDYISKFEANVDVALSVSNAVTFIEI